MTSVLPTIHWNIMFNLAHTAGPNLSNDINFRFKCNCRKVDLLIPIRRPARTNLRVTLTRMTGRDKRNYGSMNGKTCGMHWIPQNNLLFNLLDSFWHADMMICYCSIWYAVNCGVDFFQFYMTLVRIMCFHLLITFSFSMQFPFSGQ